MSKDGTKKSKRPVKILLTLLCILIGLSLIWAAFSLIGRISPDSLVPRTAMLRLSVSNPMRLISEIMAHEPLEEILSVPALSPALPFFKMLEESSILKNPLARLAAQGSLELALLSNRDGNETAALAAAWDMGLFSPLLRILPLLSGLVSVPDLYYVQAGKNSRFEYRINGQTLFIGPYRNVLFITDSAAAYEARSINKDADAQQGRIYSAIKPSAYDAVMLLAPEFIDELLSDQDAGIAAVMQNIKFDSPVEAGLSVFNKKLELRLTAPLSSHRPVLDRLLEQRSRTPGLAEQIPASAQYATILSAGTLQELYQAALVFSGPILEDSLRRADSSARTLLRLNIDDLLYSWTGNEFAVFGMEGRPHPVYAIQIADERKRQEIFDKAFRSIVLNENTRLNLDGMRIPRIEVPEFLQSLLRRWNLYLPSPYYIVHRDYLLVSESAETLLTALRAMQKNDVLPKTAVWRNIAGGRAASTAFSLYYSLDLSLPFFLRGNTALSGFFSVYRQGLIRMSFDKGLADLTITVIPGSGGGVTLMNGYPLDMERNVSNRIYRAGKAPDSRIFFTRGNTAVSFNPADNTMHELSGQGPLWVIPAEGLHTAAKNDIGAWVISSQGRVILVNGDMETAQGFPVLSGLRLSSPPAAYGGRVYLCDQDGKVHTVDAQGILNTWETSFPAALRSPPSFASVQTKGSSRSYAAVYPKSFFGEIWLLDLDGNTGAVSTIPNWPVSVSGDIEDEVSDDSAIQEWSSGIAFGSPLLFTYDNRLYIAFVTQSGKLLLFDESAALFPNFPLTLNGIFYQQPIFDGNFLWLVSDNGTLFRISLEGESLYQRISGFEVKEEGFITFFDCDGDKIPEIFITGEGNALHGYSRNFRSLEGFPLPVWGMPVFIEGSGNIKPEIMGVGMDRRLYRWQFK